MNKFSLKLTMTEKKRMAGSIELRFPPTVKFYKEFKAYAFVSLLAGIAVCIFDMKIKKREYFRGWWISRNIPGGFTFRPQIYLQIFFQQKQEY